MDTLLTLNPWIVLWVSRLFLGITMVYYGQPKIENLTSNAKDFVGMGFRPGNFWGTIVAMVEFFGGLAVYFGFYAEVWALLFGFQMMVGTFWKLKLKKDFTEYSYDLQLLALCLLIVTFGPGLFYVSRTPAELTYLIRLDVLLIPLFFAFVLAYLPEIFGERYKRW